MNRESPNMLAPTDEHWPMSDILQKIIAHKREEVASLKRDRSLEQVRAAAQAQPVARPFAQALRNTRPRGTGRSVHIIAELKLRSPSKGTFSWHGDVRRQVGDYESGGARAISVVTDSEFFGGSVDLLQTVRATVGLPVLQKDFLIEPYQVYYARAVGADAALLIASALPGGQLEEMIGLAREIGLETLVEVVDPDEMERANRGGARVIGVNNRDLRTFTVDTGRTMRLLPHCGDDQVLIAESGIHDRETVVRMMAAGVDGFLVGEALMTAPHPARMLFSLRGETLSEAAS